MTSENENRAREQAKLQLEGIVRMITRYRHAQECDGTDCDMADRDILEGLDLHYDGAPATEEERAEYHNEESALQAIYESPLSVEVRSDWESPGAALEPAEYMILLCTGGPACRIVGALECGAPGSARLEYQDWFTAWEEYPLSETEEEMLIQYASIVYGG